MAAVKKNPFAKKPATKKPAAKKPVKNVTRTVGKKPKPPTGGKKNPFEVMKAKKKG